MKFADLAEHFQQLEQTASRNLMTEILAELYKTVDTAEISMVVYLSLGELQPQFDRLEMQLADKMVVRGLAEAFQVPVSEVWGEYKKVGDLGEVSRTLKQREEYKKTQEFSVREVYEKLVEIAKEGGAGSQERKLSLLVQLLAGLDPLSCKYVVRIILGRLRLGFSEMTILDALAVMDRGSKLARTELELTYQIFPDVGTLARLVKGEGITGVGRRVKVTLGVPVVPALCQRLKSADEMIKKMGRVMVEPKFDGTRVQIHIRKSTQQTPWQIKTFTRNLDDSSEMFPELQQVLPFIDAQEAIFDCEAVGINPKTGGYIPFQETITRKRKHEIAEAIGRVPLRFMVFDVLYKDGVSLLGEPLSKRRQILAETIKPNKLMVVDEAIETDQPERLRQYHLEKLSAGLEGVVVKQINSVYEPGRRGWSWVKFKEVESAQGKLSDTIDAVVMGFYRGKGKRAGFGIGAFLVGIQGKEAQIVTLAKIGTGLTDEQWRELRKRLEQAVAMEMPKQYEVNKGLIPDVWADPTVVVEIAADEITISPVHSAGFALRFPRLVNFRDDKNIGQITGVEELAAIKRASSV